MPDVIVLDHAASICTELLPRQLWAGQAIPGLVHTLANPSPEKYLTHLKALRASDPTRTLLDIILKRPADAAPGRVALIGFGMAGCLGLMEMLKDEQTLEQVDFVAALDGLRGKLHNGQLMHYKSWVLMAERAAAGKALMVVSYSYMRGFGYPSTRDSALHLVGERVYRPEDGRVGGWVWPEGQGAFRAQEYLCRGDLHAIGAWPEGTAGDDGSAHVYHCTHVQAAVWRHFLAPRWLGQRQPDSSTIISQLTAGAALS